MSLRTQPDNRPPDEDASQREALVRVGPNGWQLVTDQVLSAPGWEAAGRRFGRGLRESAAGDDADSGVFTRVASPRDDDDDPVFTLRRLRLGTGYLINSVTHRRRRLFWLSFLLAGTLGAYAVQSSKPSYSVTTRILTQRSILPALAQPRRPLPAQLEDPLRGAVELILSRNSLEDVVDEIGIETLQPADPSPLDRLVLTVRERWRRARGSPVPQNDPRDLLVRRMQDSVEVNVRRDVIAIEVRWHDAVTAKRIAAGLVTRFLERQRSMETDELIETASILEDNAARAARRLNDSIARLREATRELDRAAARSRPPPRGRGPRAVAVARTALLEAELRDVQSSLQRLQDSLDLPRQEAERRLEQLRLSLGPRHPDVLAARRDLRARSGASGDLADLRAREMRLIEEIENRRVHAASAAAANDDAVPAEVQRSDRSGELELEQLAAEVRQRQEAYDELNGRLASTRLELETARAAFVFRYVVTEPPVVPTEESGPHRAIKYALALLAALILAAGLVVGADVWSGRIVEPWQIEVFLGVPVLADVEDP